MLSFGRHAVLGIFNIVLVLQVSVRILQYYIPLDCVAQLMNSVFPRLPNCEPEVPSMPHNSFRLERFPQQMTALFRFADCK